ncbi:hypothetical protein V6N13_064110 [Hibiscus sabdariffa]
MILIQPPSDVFEDGIKHWKNSLVGQFIGDAPNFTSMQRIIEILWSKSSKVRVILADHVVDVQIASGSVGLVGVNTAVTNSPHVFSEISNIILQSTLVLENSPGAMNDGDLEVVVGKDGGDFNIYLHANESSDRDKLGAYFTSDMRQFEECIEDHPYCGPFFTWTNKQNIIFLARKLD